MSLHEGSRVMLKLLDGIKGTVTRLPDAEHVTVLADGSGQPVRWRRSEVIELDEGHLPVDRKIRGEDEET